MDIPPVRRKAKVVHYGELDYADPFALTQLIHQIGVTRFIGRINGGLIEPKLGFEIVSQFVREFEEPPKLSWFERLVKWLKGG